MRWFWIDRFTEFVSGHYAVAIKNVTLVEEVVDEYSPGFPTFPSSLIIEGMAQTGGLLVGEHNDFKERVVLAKVAKATFHRPAMAGETLTYTARVADIQPDGAICQGTSYVGDELQAEIELVFAHLDNRFDGDLFVPADFLRMLRMLRVFEVGRDENGKPFPVPEHLLEAERLDNSRV